MGKRASGPPTSELRALYAALVVFGAIGTHLVSEFAGMGSAAGGVTFSSRHIYLGLGAVGSLALALRAIGSMLAHASGPRDAKRLAEIGLASLPFGGRRSFVPFTAALQFVLGGATEIGEGCPLCGHDIAAAIAGALVGAIVLAFAVRALGKRLPRVACAIVAFLPAANASDEPHEHAVVHEPIVRADFLWCSRLFSRPPPVLQPSTVHH
jgi:hypothetical protein